MPKNVLPPAARVLPKAGQNVWMKAFNEALDGGMSDEEASKMGWAAAKRAGYTKGQNGKWSKMESELVFDEDGGFQIGVPLIKIDTKKRIVGGFATLNNVDEASDIMEPDASLEAFTKWFGNIREMHQPKAVGKAVDFYPDTYTDEDGQTYEGIWVNAKISKGAEDTWEKVLDGTLSGFSIGGATLEKQRDIVKSEDGSTRQVWRITKYRLTELSLVDSPCNRLASISLVKSIDGAPVVEDTIGDLEEEEDLNKAWGDGEFVDLSTEYKCVVVALEALRDGAIAVKADDVAARASEQLSNYRAKVRYEVEEAEYHASKVLKDDAANNDLKKEEEIMTVDLQKEGASDNSNGEELTEDEKTIFQKFVNFLKSDDTGTESAPDDVSNIEGGSSVDTEELTKAIDTAVEGLTKSSDEKFESFTASFDEIKGLFEKVAKLEDVDAFKTELSDAVTAIADRVEALEKSGAIKKSGDDVDAVDKIEKSEDGFWSDSILPDFIRNTGK